MASRKIKNSSGVRVNGGYIQSASIRAIRSLKHAPLCLGIEAFPTGNSVLAMRNKAFAIKKRSICRRNYCVSHEKCDIFWFEMVCLPS